MSEPLDENTIRRTLEVGMRSGVEAPLRVGREIRILAEVGSTNDAVAEQAGAGAEEGLVIAAERQTDGRGRKGAAWIAPAGHNLTFSVLLRPQMPLEFWPRLSHIAALAVANGVEPWTNGMEPQLKWPNDVYADSSKLAGILVETRTSSRGSFVVLGIGLNVNSAPTDFPLELTHTLISVAALNGGTRVNRGEVCGSILAELNRFLAAADDRFPELIPEMERRSLLLGKPIRYRTKDGWEQTTMVGYGDLGEMLVQRDESSLVETILTAEEVRLS